MKRPWIVYVAYAYQGFERGDIISRHTQVHLAIRKCRSDRTNHWAACHVADYRAKFPTKRLTRPKTAQPASQD